MWKTCLPRGRFLSEPKFPHPDPQRDWNQHLAAHQGQKSPYSSPGVHPSEYSKYPTQTTLPPEMALYTYQISFLLTFVLF